MRSSLCGSPVAYANDMRIVTNDVAWSPSVEPTLQFVLGIGSDPGTTDLLSSWQLTCTVIKPADGHVGTVWFTAADVPPPTMYWPACRGQATFSPRHANAGRHHRPGLRLYKRRHRVAECRQRVKTWWHSA